MESSDQVKTEAAAGADDVTRLARAALFGGGAAAAAAGAAGTEGAAAANLLDPLSTQLTTDQLAAMLATGGYAATALGSLGGAAAGGLQGMDNAAALNALLLSGGLNLNQLTAQGLPGLGAGDYGALGGMLGAGDAGDETDAQGGGSKSTGLTVTSNKQLSSRFRGVCWNKKNKRWQAAINSSGKYLYLGSFTNEDDAARQFDKAAIKLRGKKAKLNFEYADYVDENGELIDEIVLPQGASGLKGMGDEPRGSAGGARRGSKAAADGGMGDICGLHPDLVNQAALAALMHQGAWQGMSRSGKTAVMATPLALEREQVSVLLPAGSTLEYIVPVQDASTVGANGSNGASTPTNRTLFGVVYKDGGAFGAGVWTGYMFKPFGLYDSEAAAAQTARCAGELLSEDRDLRMSGGVAAQQGMGLLGTPGLLSPAAAAAAAGGYSQDALALAGIAAAGLGSSGAAGRGGAAAAANGVAGGLLGVAPALMGAGMGGLANVSLAQATQLVQQAAAEQGLPMSYPPLSVALPVGSSGLQLATPEGGLLGGSDGGSAGGLGDVAAAAAVAAAKVASSEAEMQQLMQQLMQQQQGQQAGEDAAPQQQQLEAAAAAAAGAADAAAGGGGAGGAGFLKLAQLDMSQLRQQLLEQQQGAGGDAAGLQQQQQVLGSIPALDTTLGKRRLEDGSYDAATPPGDAANLVGDAAAAAAAAAAADASAAADAAAAAAAADADGVAAKRAKLAAGDDVSAGVAPAAGTAAGVASAGGGDGIAQLGLQDALKMLQNVQQQQQQA